MPSNSASSSAQTAFVDTAQATVVWRPLRLAYLIRAGQPEDLLDAITYACSQVGGYSHPMLPIDRSGWVASIDLDVARVLKPDFVVNYAGVDFATIGRIADSLRADPTFSRVVRFGLHPLALTAADQLRARTLMVPRRPTSVAEAVALGLVAPDQVSEWAAWVGRVQPVEDWIDLLDGQLEVQSPVGVTRSGVDTVEHSGWIGSPVIVDTARMTFRRAVGF